MTNSLLHGPNLKINQTPTLLMLLLLSTMASTKRLLPYFDGVELFLFSATPTGLALTVCVKFVVKSVRALENKNNTRVREFCA